MAKGSGGGGRGFVGKAYKNLLASARKHNVTIVSKKTNQFGGMDIVAERGGRTRRVNIDSAGWISWR